MSDAQALLAMLAALSVVVALIAGWRDHRRRRRRDLDAVGVIDWTAVQLAALVALAVLGWVALKGS